MPNWCENQLKISGGKEEVERFQQQVKGRRAVYALSEAEKKMYETVGKAFTQETEEATYNFTFHSLVPIPTEVLNAGYDPAGYNWQNRHWGTKWDVSGAEVMENEDLTYVFSTAWAPPEPWVRTVSAQFPNLTFELAYFEPGMMFAGYVVYQEGEMLEEEHVSEEVTGLHSIMVQKLGYSEEEATEFWSFLEEEDEEENA